MDKYIIIGLGNIGLKYKSTRHNIGFMVIDQLSKKHSIKINKSKHHASLGEGSIGSKSVILAKPRTYMNLSGISVKALVDWYKPNLEHVIVIYDDMDLPTGDIRIRYRGSGGSHNGIRSIMDVLKEDGFIRIRVGIGNKQEMDAANYVLGKFPKSEKAIIDSSIKNVVEAVECILEEGLDLAMNRYNSKRGKE